MSTFDLIRKEYKIIRLKKEAVKLKKKCQQLKSSNRRLHRIKLESEKQIKEFENKANEENNEHKLPKLKQVTFNLNVCCTELDKFHKNMENKQIQKSVYIKDKEDYGAENKRLKTYNDAVSSNSVRNEEANVFLEDIQADKSFYWFCFYIIIFCFFKMYLIREVYKCYLNEDYFVDLVYELAE